MESKRHWSVLATVRTFRTPSDLFCNPAVNGVVSVALLSDASEADGTIPLVLSDSDDCDAAIPRSFAMPRTGTIGEGWTRITSLSRKSSLFSGVVRSSNCLAPNATADINNECENDATLKAALGIDVKRSADFSVERVVRIVAAEPYQALTDITQAHSNGLRA